MFDKMSAKVISSESKFIKVQEAYDTPGIKKLFLDLNTYNYYTKALYRGLDCDMVQLEITINDLTLKLSYNLGLDDNLRFFILSQFKKNSLEYQQLNHFINIVEESPMAHEYHFLINNKIVHTYQDMLELTADDILDVKIALSGKSKDPIEQSNFMKKIKVVDAKNGRKIA